VSWLDRLLGRQRDREELVQAQAETRRVVLQANRAAEMALREATRISRELRRLEVTARNR